MNKSMRICVLALLAMLLCFMAQPALGEGDWRSLYQNVLRRGANTKRMVALCDLTNDGTPELAVLSINASKTATLSVHTISGGAAVAMDASSAGFDMDTFSLKGVKSASIQHRMNATGAISLSVALSAQVDGKPVNLRLGLSHAGGSKLSPFFVARTTNGQYHYNGSAVSDTQYSQAVKTFEADYKRKGSLPSATITASSTASAMQSKFKTLANKYTKFVTIKTIKLSKSEATLAVGKTLALSATVAPVTAVVGALKWSSSDESVATVDNRGTVTAHAAGTAQIAVEAQSGVKKTMKLTVTGPTISGITLDETAITLVKGGSFTLTATVSPVGTGGVLTWSSSDASIAKVDQNGKVTALKVGKANIMVKTTSNKSAICKVVVNDTGAVIVDISQHNYSTKMDWAKIAQNVDLLILRCGVTRTETAPIGVGIDAKFAFYAQQCKAYGIPFGVYFYGKCSDIETAKREAELTWATASPYNPLFYVYDVEESRLNKQLIETYMNTLKGLGAKKTGYYVAHHLYSKYKLDTSLVDFIWLPHYGKNTGKVNSSPSYACDLHQYTSVGKVQGFPGQVDVNRLMGTKSLSWFLSR